MKTYRAQLLGDIEKAISEAGRTALRNDAVRRSVVEVHASSGYVSHLVVVVTFGEKVFSVQIGGRALPTLEMPEGWSRHPRQSIHREFAYGSGRGIDATVGLIGRLLDEYKRPF